MPIRKKGKISKTLSFVSTHKTGLIIVVVAVALITGSLQIRQMLIKSLVADKQGVPFSKYLPLPTDPPLPSPSPIDSPSSSDTAVLGTSSEVSDTSTYTPPAPLPTDTPSPTFTPIPTPANTPAPTTNPQPSSSCSGTPNADNSQVYVSPSSTVINSAATISINLQDCNNNPASNDHLTIALTSGDSSVTINGASANSPYKALAQNGKYSFQVNSSNPTTAVFNIQDTDHSFQVTTPGYHNPQVTFSSSAGNPSCTPDGDARYSNAYFPSGSINVGSNATITIELRDCNNQATLGSDTITVTPKSVDPSFQFVGYGGGSFTLPHGQTSFQVTSQNPGTNTFTIRDTTQGFDVTGPGYSTPTVTFTSNATPAPSAAPTSTPTPNPSSASTPAPTDTPAPTLTPSPAPTATPSPSPTPSST